MRLTNFDEVYDVEILYNIPKIQDDPNNFRPGQNVPCFRWVLKTWFNCLKNGGNIYFCISSAIEQFNGTIDISYIYVCII